LKKIKELIRIRNQAHNLTLFGIRLQKKRQKLSLSKKYKNEAPGNLIALEKIAT
jgi:hypothetical protein